MTTTTDIPTEVQPVITAVEALNPVAVTGAKAWFARYLKGEIVLVGTVASLALSILPAGGNLAHYAAVIVGAVTIIGVVEAKNGL